MKKDLLEYDANRADEPVSFLCVEEGSGKLETSGFRALSDSSVRKAPLGNVPEQTERGLIQAIVQSLDEEERDDIFQDGHSDSIRTAHKSAEIDPSERKDV